MPDAARRYRENDRWPPHSHLEGGFPFQSVHQQRCTGAIITITIIIIIIITIITFLSTQFTSRDVQVLSSPSRRHNVYHNHYHHFKPNTVLQTILPSFGLSYYSFSQSLMTAFLPTLPISSLNTSQWSDWTNALHINPSTDQHQSILNSISRNNEAMKKYFTAQLKMLAKQRLDSNNEKNTDWVMSIWATIEPRLKALMRVVIFLLTPTHPYPILASNNKKAQVLASRIMGKGDGEKVLTDFWDYTCDLTVKTAFWKSTVVQQLLKKD